MTIFFFKSLCLLCALACTGTCLANNGAEFFLQPHRLRRSFSGSLFATPCNDYFNSIFAKNYRLNHRFQLRYHYTVRSSQLSGEGTRRIEFKLYISPIDDTTTFTARYKKYHSATIFIPGDLDFNNALKIHNINRSHHSSNIEAGFRRSRDGEVIICSEPIQGIILLSSGSTIPTEPGQREVDFWIESVPSSKKIQFYALLVLDLVQNEAVQNIVTVKLPAKTYFEDDQEEELMNIGMSNRSVTQKSYNFRTFGFASSPLVSRQEASNYAEDDEGEQNGAEYGGNISVDQLKEEIVKLMLQEDARIALSIKNSNYRVDPKYLKHVVPDYIINDQLIYTGCGRKYSCFEHPPDCHKTRSCLVNLRFSNITNGVRMIITARTWNWVAVGLSEDNLMGNDAVVICRRAPNSAKASLWEAYNPPRPDGYSLGTVTHLGEHAYVRPVAGSNYNGILTCEFQVKEKFRTSSNLEINLAENEYYILLAVGLDNLEPNGIGSIRSHEISLASDTLVYFYLGSPRIIRSQKRLSIAFHEELAIINYAFLIPAAILMSRYGQHGFHQPAFGNYPWWLVVHLCFQSIAIIFNTLGLFAIYIFRTGSVFYTTSSLYHGLVGPVVYIMSFTNAILGYLIYTQKGRGTSVSTYLQWGHCSLGHSNSFLGAIELIRGPYIPKSNLSCSFSVVAAFNYLCFAGANLLLMFNTELLRDRLKMDYPLFRSFFGPAIGLMTDVPKKTFNERRYIVYFSVVTLFLCTIILLLELIFSEQTCSINSKDYI